MIQNTLLHFFDKRRKLDAEQSKEDKSEGGQASLNQSKLSEKMENLSAKTERKFQQR